MRADFGAVLVVCNGGSMVTHPLWRPFTAGANAVRQGQRIAFRQTQPGSLQRGTAAWAQDFAAVSDVVRAAIPDQVLAIRHVGSTAVAGLLAKPVIDIDLTVPDVEDEAAYLPRLGAAGFLLIFRDEMAGDPHRHLTFAAPNTNLHLWNEGAIEPQRHALFTGWLRASEADRRRYDDAKEAAAAGAGAARYNDLKAVAVYDIYERAFAADPSHHHDPQPRSLDS